MNRLRHALSALAVLSALTQAPAIAAPPQLRVNTETGETATQFAKRTQWWRDGKFGMFIHWGVYSVPNTDHKNTEGLGEWYMANLGMQVPEYEKFASEFDPTPFNAHDIVALAKAAGMKYITITSKHHDGFCMFDTKLTDYNIVKSTPYHHDPMKDLAAECKKQGVKLCFYYSVKDWHSDDYVPHGEWDHRPKNSGNLDRYVTYMEGQLRELLTNYGPIGGIWFDGHLDHNAKEEHATEVVKMMRSIQPGIMINDRINLPEDYDTPENAIPDKPLPGGRLWETCLTINGHWGYAWSDENFKSSQELVHTLCDVVSKGGNLLLNVGPDATGTIPAGEVTRLQEIGKWMSVNGDSIRGTTRCPFKSLPFDGRCTQKGKDLYLQVFQWPDSGLKLAHLAAGVHDAVALDGNERLAVQRLADGTVEIAKPSRLDPAATVIRLRMASSDVVDPLALLIQPQAEGSYTLTAREATVSGDTARSESSDNIEDIGYWTNIKDTVSWDVAGPQRETQYKIALEFACIPECAGGSYAIGVDGSKLPPVTGITGVTANWDTYKTVDVPGLLTLRPGKATVRVTPLTMPGLGIMNLRKIVLTPVTQTR
jgi:alpha-L-fucosidase